MKSHYLSVQINCKFVRILTLLEHYNSFKFKCFLCDKKHFVKYDGSIVLIPVSFKPSLMIDLFVLIASAKNGFEISPLSPFLPPAYI
jgi:hypothetical protein